MTRRKSSTYDDRTIVSAINVDARSADEAAAPLAWGGYIIRPSDPKSLGYQGVPNACGIYAWYSREGDLLYVGRSVSMNSRLRDHHMTMWGGLLVSYREVPEQYVSGVELAHIKTLSPFHNVSMAGRSLPFWEDFCAAIDSAWRDVLPAMQERVSARESAIAEQIAARL